MTLRPLLFLLPFALACRAGDKGPEGGASGVDTGALDVDLDGDGFPASEDCDDSDASVNAGAEEVCDGVDNDCDGEVDEGVSSTWYTDDDGDGYGDAGAPVEGCEQPDGAVDDDSDCDDGDDRVYPDARELCDGIDNDCNGTVDDGGVFPWYADADGDGHGDPSTEIEDCAEPEGYVAEGDDCDDADAAVNPGADEVCNAIDDDCDGDIDEPDAVDAAVWYRDRDADGYGDDDTARRGCEAPSGFVDADGDCDDTDADIHPDAAEVCNAVDDDCDGLVDDADSSVDTSTGSSWYVDNDGDGYGDPSTTVEACTQPSASSTDNTDCDDTDATIRPDTNGECALGESCDDILDLGRSTGDGDYVIDPDGYGTGLDPFEVYCDMTTDGGGWTEIAYSADLTFQQHFTGGDGWQWQPSDFSFELSDAQIAAIQAVSAEGYQLYEGRCEHVIHYYYTSGSTYGYAFGFEFFDGTQTPRGSSSYAPYDISVTADGCAGNGGEGGSLTQTTDFEIDSVLVPVRNVQCRDCGDTFPEYYGSVLTDNPAWLR